MSETSVEITARCPGDCGADAEWRGTVVAAGGGTEYTVIDCPKCGPLPVDLRKIATTRSVPSRETSPLTSSTYWTRLTSWRNTA